MKYGQENVDLQVYGSPKNLSTPMQLLAQESLATLRRRRRTRERGGREGERRQDSVRGGGGKREVCRRRRRRGRQGGGEGDIISSPSLHCVLPERENLTLFKHTHLSHSINVLFI